MNGTIQSLNGRDRMKKDNLLQGGMGVRSCVGRLFEGVSMHDHDPIFDVHMRTTSDATAIHHEEDRKEPFEKSTQSLSHRAISLIFARKSTIKCLYNNKILIETYTRCGENHYICVGN